MALKPDRSFDVPAEISFFCSTTSNKGYVVVFDTTAGGGSGAAMDNANAKVKVLSTEGSASGTLPAGVLINDVVNKDLTQTHLNFDKDEVQAGGKVTVMRKGWVVTNAVSGTPTIGAKAYYNDLSEFTTSSTANGSIQVGRFLSKLDADGYAKVYVDIV